MKLSYTPRGTLTPNRPMADLSWLRVGGPAELLFQPADPDDLAAFLKALPADTSVFPIGVCSNLIIRDGGIKGCLLYTSPSPRDKRQSRMPSSA